MKKITVSILTGLLMLSMVFSSSVFAAEKTTTAWDSFLGLFSGNVTTSADTQVNGVTYRTHIQNEGWAQGWISDGKPSGSEGKSYRLEGIEIKIDNTKLPVGLGITYQTQIENDGWAQGWVSDGKMSGSEGRGLRLEGIQIKLTGTNASDYSVRYKTHIQNKGWETGWTYDGNTSGTVGEGLRLEAIEIEIVQKEASLTAYNAALAAVNKADYTAASWATYQAVVAANPAATTDLQSEVDAATAAITAAQGSLQLVPKVTSVTAINARQYTVAFNTAMDKTTLMANTNTSATTDDYVLLAAMAFTPLELQPAVTITGAAGGAVGSLSADGKTLTVTLGGTEFLTGNYTVVVNTSVRSAKNIALPALFTTNINVKDTVRPTLAGVTYTNFQIADIGFSEPIATTGAITFKLADGTDLAVQPAVPTVVNGKIQVDLTAVTDVNKNITATIIGAADFAGNVISPNPITVTLIKNTSDTTKPTVASVTVTSGSTFDIKFSEALIADPTIAAISGNAVVPVKDTTDATVYHATIALPVTGLQTVSVTAFTDLSNNAGVVPANRVVNFSADTAKPTIASSKVEKINGIEYLVVTYNKNVTPNVGAVINGTYIDNYVTTPMPTLTTGAADTAFALYKPVDGKSNSVQIELTTLTKSTEYTVTLPALLVTDLFGNTSAEVTNFKFTRTTNSSTDAPKISLVSVIDNNTIQVQFDRPVAGASAITLANYSLEGTVLASATLIGNTTNGLVELKITKDSNTLTGIRTLAVSGITSQTGDMMTAANVAVTLNENVRPTVKTAIVTSTSVITLTMSEAIDPLTIAAADFEVYIGGNKVTTAVTAAASLTSTKDVTLTLATPLTATDLSAGIVVKPATGITTADVVGNVVNLTQITVTQ